MAAKPVIYQLVVRYFGNINQTNRRDGSVADNGCGKFEDINDAALTAIKQLRATHVWLTGCLRQATLTDYGAFGLPADDPDVVKGIAGSLFAIKDQFDVCPDYARNPADRMAEFDALVARTHAAGLKVVIDFVGNHVARDYRTIAGPEAELGRGDDVTRFFDPGNNFFYLVQPPGQVLRLSRPAHWNPTGFAFDGRFAGEDGGAGRPPKATGNNVCSPAPAAGDWYETVKLNYGYNFVDLARHFVPRPRTWDMMDQVLAHWQARHVDGFRCDFAHYVPAEAWDFLISQARRRRPETIFIAEAYPFPNSRDPVTDKSQLIDAGFDGLYHFEAYNQLKKIYQGTEGQDEYDRQMTWMPEAARSRAVGYLENHDERRIASPIVTGGGTGDSGFGSAEAGYQLAPLQLLYGPGPVIMLNGQEVGEPGAGVEGFNTDDGRTTFFDYWCMPEFRKWVNGRAYDGGGLSAAQRKLRAFYAALLSLCQDPAVRSGSYWGLKYFNRPDRFADCPGDLYTFARFQPGAGRIVVVAANFRPGAGMDGRVRIPSELAAQAVLPAALAVRLVLDRDGAKSSVVAQVSRQGVVESGFAVSLPDQSAHVYVLE